VGIGLTARARTDPASEESPMTDYDVHLVGSVPLANAEAVFRSVSGHLGPALLRLPDGETGDRSTWLNWLDRVFAEHGAFVPSGDTFQHHPFASPSRKFKLRDGVRAADVEFDNLPQAAIAIDSYRIFARLKAEGVVPAHVRFQCTLAHPYSVIRRFLPDELFDQFERKYADALIEQVGRIAAAVPHDQLAIQWDVASATFFYLEKDEPTRFGRTKAEMQETFTSNNARLGNSVPGGAELLYHLCYGDSGHRHSIEPGSTADMVTFANRLSDKIERPIQLFHMPVPRGRTDDAYFAPLDGLRLKPETRVALGLIHLTDGLAGTRTRIAAAKKHLDRFLVATECGFGRRPPETVEALLRLHAEVAGIPAAAASLAG
jgi:hypothetical protein